MMRRCTTLTNFNGHCLVSSRACGNWQVRDRVAKYGRIPNFPPRSGLRWLLPGAEERAVRAHMAARGWNPCQRLEARICAKIDYKRWRSTLLFVGG